ncbi:MAG: ribosomal-processing cysteine protease Prp [Bacilli bacterium]
MIQAKVWRAENGRLITRFVVKGHAGSGVPGHDLVCAAVSALTINFVNSVEAICGLTLEHRVKSGFFDLIVTEDPDVQLLARSLEVGLVKLAEDHGQYIEVVLREQ